LDALTTDTRANLQTLLIEFGSALTREPTAAENAEQSPVVRNLNAAQALKQLYIDSPEALKNGAIVTQALGGVEEHDISKLIAGTEKFSSQLDVHEQQLGELIGNFNTFLGALAAQSPSLSSAVAELPATLRNARRGFAGLAAAAPPLRTFAKDLIP